MGTLYFYPYMKSIGDPIFLVYMDEKYGDPILLLYEVPILLIHMRSMGTLYFYPYMKSMGRSMETLYFYPYNEKYREKYGDPILLLYG